ncbi:MAG: hypothetical protein U0800_14690 [Isosphaeraceae bacterium]
MKRPQSIAIGAILVAALIGVAGSRAPQAASGQVANLPPQWEYHVSVQSNPRTPQELNRLGAEGWELCTVTSPLPNEQQTYTLLFKRPKR